MMKISDLVRYIPLAGERQRQLVGIELGATSLKMVLLNPGPRKEVAGLVSRDIRGLSDADLSQTVVSAFKELGCGNPLVALIVPSQIVISKNIEVPSTDSGELREIINLQAARHTPFSREEIIIDYIPIGTFKQNYSKILLLIVTSAAVKKQIAILERAGVRTDKVLLCQEGIGLFAEKSVRTVPGEVAGFLHIDETSTDFSVVLKNRVIFIRSIPIGAQHLTQDRARTAPKFIEEVKRSLETYRAECIEKDLGGLFVTGAAEELENIDIALEAETRLPVKVIAYWNSFVRSALRPLAPGQVSFLDILAPLSSYAECRVNLLPEELRLKRTLRQRGMELFATGILVLSLFLMLLFISMGRLYFKGEYLKALQLRYKALAGNARELEKVYQQNSVIRSYLVQRGASVRILSELHEITPINISLGDIRFDREGKFTARGTGDSMSTVFSFVDLLEKSKYFKDVKTKYTTKRQEGKNDVMDFEINAVLNKVAE